MDALELIRNADCAADVLAALAVYTRSLRDLRAIPEWCVRLPIEGDDDVSRRMAAIFSAVNFASRNLRDRECRIAKHALRVFAAAAWRLRRLARRGAAR